MRKRDAFEYICMLGVFLGLIVLIYTAIVPVSDDTQSLMSYSALAVAIIMGTYNYRSTSKSRQ